MVINHSKMGEVGRGGGEKWDREGRSRSGGGVEASSGRKADSGSGKSRRTTQIFSRPRPRSLTLRDAAPSRPQDGGGESPFMPASHVEQM